MSIVPDVNALASAFYERQGESKKRKKKWGLYRLFGENKQLNRKQLTQKALFDTFTCI